jgi:hypothetical protein
MHRATTGSSTMLMQGMRTRARSPAGNLHRMGRGGEESKRPSPWRQSASHVTTRSTFFSFVVYERVCCMCKQSTQPGERMKCVVGSASARCTPSKTAPFYYCYGCTGAFVDAHRSLLAGFLGADQRRQAVAWAERGVFQSAGTVGGPQPVNATVQDIFRSSEADEAKLS